MYKNGEIEMIMDNFERAIQQMPVYVGGSLEREDKTEIEGDDGRISKIYRNNYYSNGRVNELFVSYLWGYALGKSEAMQ